MQDPASRPLRCRAAARYWEVAADTGAGGAAAAAGGAVASAAAASAACAAIPPIARLPVPRDSTNPADVLKWTEQWTGSAVPAFPIASDNDPRPVSAARFKKTLIAASQPRKLSIIANMVKSKPAFVSSNHCEVERPHYDHKSQESNQIFYWEYGDLTSTFSVSQHLHDYVHTKLNSIDHSHLSMMQWPFEEEIGNRFTVNGTERPAKALSLIIGGHGLTIVPFPLDKFSCFVLGQCISLFGLIHAPRSVFI